jgi:hypothetical protein
MSDCPICRSDAKDTAAPPDRGFDCPRCGAFKLTGTAVAVLHRWIEQKPHWRALVSHAVRRMQRDDGEPIRIFETELPTFVARDRLPPPHEQADQLILWIGDHQPAPDAIAEVTEISLDAWIGAALPRPNFTPSVTQVLGFPRLLDRGLTTAGVSTRADRRHAARSGSEWREGSWCERWPTAQYCV